VAALPAADLYAQFLPQLPPLSPLANRAQRLSAAPAAAGRWSFSALEDALWPWGEDRGRWAPGGGPLGAGGKGAAGGAAWGSSPTLDNWEVCEGWF